MQLEKLGITGTKQGMTEAQIREFKLQIESLKPRQLHHGDCIGADAQAAAIARSMGVLIISHPPLNPKYRAWAPFDVEKHMAEYHVRNENIVDASQLMIGFPKLGREELRSGTWSCIRYARKVGKPIRIIYPDGKIAFENI
jgi:hypothetical protein